MRLALIAGATVALAVPAASHGATTIGPPLPGNNLGINGAGGGVTFVQTELPGHTNESPIDGVVVRYRVEFGDWGTVRLRILRPAAGGAFSVARSGTPHLIGTAFDALLRTFTERVPISQGDQIAIDADAVARLTSVTGAHLGYWAPIKTESDPATVPTIVGGSGQALALNADVEPDVDRDGFGDETQDCAPADPTLNTACPPPAAKRKCKKGFRLKKVKTKSGKKKKKCVRKKKKSRR